MHLMHKHEIQRLPRDAPREMTRAALTRGRAMAAAAALASTSSPPPPSLPLSPSRELGTPSGSGSKKTASGGAVFLRLAEAGSSNAASSPPGTPGRGDDKTDALSSRGGLVLVDGLNTDDVSDRPSSSSPDPTFSLGRHADSANCSSSETMGTRPARASALKRRKHLYAELRLRKL